MVICASNLAKQWWSELLPEGWLSCPTSSVRFCGNRKIKTPHACCEYWAHGYSACKHTVHTQRNDNVSCFYVFTSLCKVWWILWMLASVVKWEFSWKSGSTKNKGSMTIQPKQNTRPSTANQTCNLGTRVKEGDIIVAPTRTCGFKYMSFFWSGLTVDSTDLKMTC